MKEAGLVIRKMQLTEKATALAEKSKYFFEVAPGANKIDVKRAVEELYKVSVVSVNTMKYAGKRKRERRLQYGKRSDWKRAIVTLRKGDSIDLT